MWATCRHGLFVLIEKLLRWCVSPHLRAKLLAWLGAHVGKNVRVYEVQFFNLSHGFQNLRLSDDVHIGPGCRLDLEGELEIGARSTLSPGVTVLTHQDPGSSHGTRLVALYPPCVATTRVGEDCWVGTNAILLAGITIHDLVVVAAGSVVTSNIPAGNMVAGSPARIMKTLNIPKQGIAD